MGYQSSKKESLVGVFAYMVSMILTVVGSFTFSSHAYAEPPNADDAQIRLMRNENPLGMSPMVEKHLSEVLGQLSSVYPDFGQRNAKAALASKLNVSADSIAFGSGSDEIIRALPKLLVHQGQNIVAPQYSYIGHQNMAKINKLSLLEAPVGNHFEVTTESILNTVNAKTAFVILANPSNPTGFAMGDAEMEKLATELEKRGISLVIDMAYREYVTDPATADPFKIQRGHQNIILTGTFSKIYGLAGLRVGYLVASPEITKKFDDHRDSTNVSTLALEAVTAALKDDDWLDFSRRTNFNERAYLRGELDKMGLQTFSSEGNYILVHVGPQAPKIVEALLVEDSISILGLSHYKLPEYVRITVGSHEINRMLITKIKQHYDLLSGKTCRALFEN